jgi:hypothetical protein
MKSRLTSTFYRLPLPLQQAIYCTVFRGRYLHERELRRVDGASYSLKPFDMHRCIFIHIPKAAGISVLRSLFGSLGGAHRSARKYRLIFGDERFRDYFKFTFVRNPWDRLVSAFFFLKHGGLNAGDRRFSRRHLARFDTFGAFVRHWLRPRNLHHTIHFVPQHEFICLRKLTIAVDFIGRFETLETDFARIAERLGIECTLDHCNPAASRRPDYRTYYDERTRAIVANVYAEDIALLDYDF